MDKANRYYIGYIVGIVLSVAAGIAAGVLVTDTAVTGVATFAVLAVALAGVSVITAFALAVANTYSRNCALSRQLSNHVLMLIIGTVVTVAAACFIALLMSTGAAGGVALKVLTAFAALGFGLVFTADLSFIYWLTKRNRGFDE